MCTADPNAAVDPRHALGRRGEELAFAHFQRLGFAALARNSRTRFGEIDLIAFDGRTIVFVEVKTSCAHRPDEYHRSEPPLARLGPRQRARLRRLASAWLSEPRRDRPTAAAIRFDAVGVLVDRAGELVALDHIENAF